MAQIGDGFTFLIPPHPDSPGQNSESCKMVVVVVVIVLCVFVSYCICVELL